MCVIWNVNFALAALIIFNWLMDVLDKQSTLLSHLCPLCVYLYIVFFSQLKQHRFQHTFSTRVCTATQQVTRIAQKFALVWKIMMIASWILNTICNRFAFVFNNRGMICITVTCYLQQKIFIGQYLSLYVNCLIVAVFNVNLIVNVYSVSIQSHPMNTNNKLLQIGSCLRKRYRIQAISTSLMIDRSIYRQSERSATIQKNRLVEEWFH